MNKRRHTSLLMTRTSSTKSVKPCGAAISERHRASPACSASRRSRHESRRTGACSGVLRTTAILRLEVSNEVQDRAAQER